MPRMTRNECREFLMEGTRTVKVATMREDGRPHVVPIWFVMYGEDLIFTTGKESVKGRAIRRRGDRSGSGPRGIRRAVAAVRTALGRVSDAAVRTAHCPVLVVHGDPAGRFAPGSREA